MNKFLFEVWLEVEIDHMLEVWLEVCVYLRAKYTHRPKTIIKTIIVTVISIALRSFRAHRTLILKPLSFLLW